MPFYLPRSVRNIGRLQTVARVLARHGFGHLVERLNLASHLPLASRWRVPVATTDETGPRAIGRRLVAVCQELGPTFVKLGQMISTRPDLLPAPTIDELKQLQDRVAPFPSAEARKTIEQDLGQPVQACFSELPDEPFASGSIAQVYNARTISGRSVVVKVKRPGIEETVRLDLNILRWLTDGLERALPEIRVYRPRTILEEFERTIHREMDFIYEASSIARFADAFKDDEVVTIPEVMWDLTGTQVLTMGRIGGTSLRQILAAPERLPRQDRERLANALADLFFRQYFELGTFHADPHPGNIFLTPDDKIGLIDFGIVGQIDDELAGQLAVGLLAAVNKEIDVIVDVLGDVGAIGPTADEHLLRRDLRDLLDKYYGLPLWRMNLQTLFFEVTEIMRRRGITLPRDFVLMGKSLVMITGVVLELDPNLNLVELLRPRILQMLRLRFGPSRVLKAAGMTGWHLINIVKNAPRQLRNMLRRMSRGEWQVNIRHQNLEYLASELDRSSNRLSFAIVIAGIVVGSSMIISSPLEQETILGVPLPVLGLAGYVFAGILGIALVWAIWRSGRMS